MGLRASVCLDGRFKEFVVVWVLSFSLFNEMKVVVVFSDAHVYLFFIYCFLATCVLFLN